MPEQDVAVIGGGIAGISAALELSQHDLNIQLIEKSPFLGGHAIHYTCKADGVCRECNACLAEDQLKRIHDAENVHLHLASQLQGVEHRDGAYQLETKQLPLFSSREEQEALGALAKTDGWRHLVRRAPSRHDTPFYTLDRNGFEELREADSSAPEAVACLNPDKPARSELMRARAIVLATGFQPFDPHRIGTFNYSSLSNVVSPLDMEHIRRTSGFHLRPSDHARPERVAFIQCVGSRSAAHGNLWCSRVCCPYALRMAGAMQAEQPESEITFFYMDLQNCNMISPKTLNTPPSSFRFVRMMPVDLLPGEGDSVIIRYMAHEEAIREESFDLVVLSVGMEPSPENAGLARMFDIALNRHGFFRAASEMTPGTPRDKGIFPAGAATGPKDIAESMEQAGETAKDLLSYLGSQEIHYGYERSHAVHTGADHRDGLDRTHRSP